MSNSDLALTSKLDFPYVPLNPSTGANTLPQVRPRITGTVPYFAPSAGHYPNYVSPDCTPVSYTSLFPSATTVVKQELNDYSEPMEVEMLSSTSTQIHISDNSTQCTASMSYVPFDETVPKEEWDEPKECISLNSKPSHVQLIDTVQWQTYNNNADAIIIGRCISDL